jgi:NADPH-dependent curcumin reductase CurA
VPEDFDLVEEAIPKPRDGAILVRNHLCSLDPAIRGWLEDAPSYIPPIALNDAVRAITVGRNWRAAERTGSGDFLRRWRERLR